MQKFKSDVVTTAVFSLLTQLLNFLGKPEEQVDISSAIKSFNQLKSESGNQAIAEMLGLDQPEMGDFSKAIRDLERLVTRSDSGDRNSFLAQFRFITWMESISDQIPDLSVSDDIEALTSEDLGRKKVRSLELILRSLINERYGDQDVLEKELVNLFSSSVVKNWKNRSDQGDLLSGTTFSELASLFVNDREFVEYSHLFEDSAFLTFLKDKRKTIQNFLEDIRRIRNILSHNRQVTNSQLSLMDLYYEELITPVQDAHDQGATKVNPDEFLDVSNAELEQYFANLHEDVLSVKDDLADFRSSVESAMGVVAEDARNIRETTSLIGQRQIVIGLGVLVTVIGIGLILFYSMSDKEDTQQIRESTQRLEQQAESIADTTEQLNQSVTSIQEGFLSLNKQGGVIAEAQRPEEFYHNARIYELRGDFLNARKSYEQFLSFGLETIDAHLRYQDILKSQEGKEGAARTYAMMNAQQSSVVYETASSLMLEGEQRSRALDLVASQHPEFSPVYYLQSEIYSVKQKGQQSLNDKRAEKKALERFVELADKGQLLKYFIDKEMARKWQEEADSRLKTLNSINQVLEKPPFSMNASRSNSGWHIYFLFNETVSRFYYRLEGEENYRDNGVVDQLNQFSGIQEAKTDIQLSAAQQDTFIYIKYRDIHGKENGPYKVPFNVDNQLVSDQKKSLAITRGSWLSFRDFDGKLLLYFTHLQSYNCAIAEVYYGLDSQVPNVLWNGLTPCNQKDPHRIADNAELYKSVPLATKFVSVQLVYKDGTKSEINIIEKM